MTILSRLRWCLPFLYIFLTLSSNEAHAQTSNPSVVLGQDTTRRVINTAVPFLNITPDARAAGMGDVGVATSPDANSTHWNVAKLVFVEKKYGFSLSYTPWLARLVNDMFISYLSGYYKLDDRQAIAASLRYFNLGSIQFTDNNANVIRDFTPRELAFDVAYSRKLSERFSVGLAFRYIHSNLSADLVINSNQQESKAVNSVSADVSMYYHSDDIDMAGLRTKVAFGAVISNIGPKVTYSNASQADFIPINFRVGGSMTTHLDDYNRFTLAVDLNKLMVPTPPLVDTRGNVVSGTLARSQSVIGGMFGSFADAPGGFKEEMQEITIGTGLEYWYSDKMGNDIFSARLGYFYEDASKGNRKYFTLGAGIRYNIFGLDLAYIISQYQNPLSDTFRFTFLFSFDQEKK